MGKPFNHNAPFFMCQVSKLLSNIFHDNAHESIYEQVNGNIFSYAYPGIHGYIKCT